MEPEPAGPRISPRALAFETHGLLARSGEACAVRVLRAAAAGVIQWEMPLDALLQSGHVDALEGLDELLSRRTPDPEAMDERVARLGNTELALERWGESKTVFARALRARDAWSRPLAQVEEPDWSALSLEQMLARAATPAPFLIREVRRRVAPGDIELLLRHLDPQSPDVSRAALAGLGELDSPQMLPMLRRFLEANLDSRPVRMLAAARAPLRRLQTPEAREWGLEWLHAPNNWARSFSLDLLFGTAVAADLPRLEEALRAALRDEDEYQVCRVCTVLGKIGAQEALPLLRIAFEEATYSWARWEAGEAVMAISPAVFQAEYAEECLFDCEERVRELVLKANSGCTAPF
jgi:HEAT repeat protein